MREDRDKEREIKPKKKIKSYPILVISGFYIVLFAVMLFYIARYSYVNRQTLMNNNYNKRQQILLAQNSRGKILSRNGDVLAYSQEGADGKDVRVYPYGKEFAHVVGYASNGKAGIEASANYYLINSGAELATKVKFDAEGHKYPGDTVTTTLDVTLQEVAFNALSARKGAIIVSNPKTGEILAMVSKPDFDPNNIASEWDKMLADDSGDAQLLNRATQGLYPPGSTFKIVTALAYLRDNNNDYTGYKYSCNGKFKEGEDVISCYHGENHGGVDFVSSFAKSCNTSFANIGLSIKQATFKATLTDLMFNSELPLSLTYSKSSATYEPSTSKGDVMQLSIGQGTTSMSPIHLNMITCAIANGGTLMKPYLVKSVTTEDKKTVASFEPESYKRLMTKEEADILTTMMVQVVQSGTGTRLKGLSYSAAGKTGSAEFNSNSDSHAWFTGFAPAEDPEICVTIIVENAGSGGSYAVPIAKRIFDAYFGVE